MRRAQWELKPSPPCFATVPRCQLSWIIGLVLIVAGVISMVRRGIVLGIVLVILGIILGGLQLL